MMTYKSDSFSFINQAGNGDNRYIYNIGGVWGKKAQFFILINLPPNIKDSKQCRSPTKYYAIPGKWQLTQIQFKSFKNGLD